MDNLWYAWLILGALFIVAELFTAGFVLLWFGVGALVAALLSYTGLVGLPIQVLVFLVVSVLLTVASRRIFEQVMLKSSPGKALRTGVEALPGQTGIVVSASTGAAREAAVKVFGSTWRAFPTEGEEPLEEGEQVRVERVEGVSIYVRRLGHLPSWRAQNQLPE